MQRRAGAAFVTFFLLVGAVALALVPAASKPHTNGLWGVVIVSSVVAIMMAGMTFLPSRY